MTKKRRHIVFSLLLIILLITGQSISCLAQEQKPWLDSFSPTRELYVSPTGVNPLILQDLTGQGNTGTLSGYPVHTDGHTVTSTGQPSQAIYLNGIDDFITLQTPVGTWGTSYTIEAWIKTNSSASHSSTVFPILGVWGGASSAGVGQAFGINGGHLSFAVSENAASGCQDVSFKIEGPSINDGTWHHVAAVINQSTNTVSLFVDGIKKNEGNMGDIADSGCGIPGMSFIGSTGGWPSIFLNATLDELRVSGRAFTATEIASRYNAGVDAHDSLDSSTVSLWNFSQPSGGTLNSPLTLPAAIRLAEPGDLFWLLGGEYLGPYIFTQDGTGEKPIVFRAYKDENAKIIGYIKQSGAHNWFWGLEITDPDGLATQDDSSGGILSAAPGLHVINCHIHHNLNRNGLAAWNTGANHVFYGNIVHSAGKGNIPTDGSNWHGVYTHNNFDTNGRKYFVNNVFMDNDAGILSHNFHGYATCKDCPPLLTGFYVTQNVFANRPFLIGGYNVPAQQHIVNDNYFYQANAAFGFRRPVQTEFRRNYIGRGFLDLRWLWGTGETIYQQVSPNIFTDNKIILPSDYHNMVRTSAYMSDGRCEGCPKIQETDQFDQNTYSAPFKGWLFAADMKFEALNLSEWKQRTAEAGNSFDSHSKEIPAPTQEKIVLLPNDYDSNRAHLLIYNWGLKDSVSVDLSAFLPAGTAYRIFSIKSPNSNPIQTGIYQDLVSIEMKGQEFLTFLVTTSLGDVTPLPPQNLRIAQTR